FSSVTGAFGNPGQCDYAVANAFMDAYAKYRTALVASGQRQGQTLSVNWPLWKDGGMKVDAKIENSMRQNMGLVAMKTTTGIRALYQGIALGFEQMVIMEGDRKRLHEVFLGQLINTETTQTPGVEQNKVVTADEQDLLGEKVVDFLKQLFSSIIKLPPHRIEEDAPLEKYGIDSVMIMQLTNQLEKRFGSLPKTLFFEYQNIQELSEYFLQSYREQLLHLFAIEDNVAAAIDDPGCFAARTKPVKPSFGSRKRSRFISLRTQAQEKKEIGPLDIAIIGVSGRYPQADNMQEFWRNMRDGRDCITEIPPSRWDYHQYYTRNKDIAGTMYSKWGGFLADIDKFDPLLFNIAPLDAHQIDPQERLFMETVWETMEDAGYSKNRLRKHAKVGVFAGVMWSEYQLLGDGHRENGVLPIQSFASIANRISYFYNFNGPSIALDTMCSSSLTAIYLACNSICHGDCEMAVAGGVSLSLHPNKYLQLCRNRFLSSDGRCRSFGEGGDGYVPGEGVGAVLLKPLQKAIADQDQIYAVIKDISINHGGKTNGYTVPNLNAQADLIAESLHKAQVDPRTITYIEAHGTGTSLGDPIEINGLTKAYHKFTQDKQYCAVGSVKSNIGHLEAAAGMAGLTKVLLQLKHKQIVPSLHSEKLNSNIEFDNSPFYVQQKLTEWTPITENKNGIFQTLPRRAAISSFGAGGANAHMILEEYQSITKSQECERVSPQIMLLSARTKACLYEYAKRLRDFCSNSRAAHTDNAVIADIAYTLQIGREPMEERMAIIGKTWKEFIDGLTKFVNRQEMAADLNTIFYGCTAGLLPVLSKEQSREKVNVLIQQRDMEKLAALWVEGVSVPWEKLDHGNIISLPAYPFEQKSYWISAKDNHSASGGEPVTTGNQVNNQAGNLARNEMEEIKETGSNSNAAMSSFDDENSLQQVVIDQYRRGEEEQSAAGFNEIQDLLKQVVAQELGLEPEELNPEVNFEVYGLDSFARIKIINDLQKEFGDIVDIEVIFDQNTVNKLAGYINGKVNQHQPAAAETMISNNRDAAGQNSKIKPLTLTAKQPSRLPADSPELKTKNILLTGVTGVLGGRLVWEYLNHSDSMLYCLLRAENLVQAKQRIQAMLEVHDPDHELLSEFDRRVIPVLGDITHPSLEMSPELYQELAATIDMVVHCAGKTSLHGLYNEVKGVNVAGVQNMVNFALKTPQKYFIHISTIYGIMGDHQFKEGEVFTENDFDFGQQFNKLGYSQSKFEAEKIIRSTKDLKWIIMRSGYIMGDSKKGYYPFNLTNTPGIFYDFFKTAIELGMAIDNPWHFDITPIDYVSRSIVWLSMSVKNIYQTYHLSNPDYKTYKDIMAMIDKVGYPIRFVSAGEYMNNLHSENNGYRSISTELIMFNPSMVQKSHVDTTYTRKVLAQGGIICPEINEKLIAVYLDYCSKVGYLKNSSSNHSFWNWQFQKLNIAGGM
ncbi:beta-ketoacyl synthase N-terminal-like domain-containing protein, partial [Sporomusa ovata]